MNKLDTIVKIHNKAFNDNKDLSYFNGLNLYKVIVYEDFGYLIIIDSIDVLEIFEIAVDPTHQKKGIAYKMLSEISDKKDILLEVKENNIAAIKLYEKCGFEKISLRKGYYNGVDAIIMKKHGII